MKRCVVAAVAMTAVAMMSGALTGAAQAASENWQGPSLLSLQSKAVKSGGRTRVIVEMHDARLPEASTDRARQSSIRALQTSVLARALRSTEAAGAVTRMDYVPMFAITASADELSRIAADDRVIGMYEDELAKPFLKDSLTIIRATGTGGVHGLGAKGQGRAVAILDTGSNRNHEFLRGRVISEACYNTNDDTEEAVSRCPGKLSDSIKVGSAADCGLAITGCGHGTHVAGIAAGRNTSFNGSEPRVGVAPMAGIVAINVFTRFKAGSAACGGTGSKSCVLSFTSDQIRGMERVYSLRDGVKGRKIDAINMSLGGGYSRGYCNNDPRKTPIELLRRVGIATVIASGNEGFGGDGGPAGVAFPACVKAAITVGASTKFTAANPEQISWYSNQGTPVDVLAPGGDTTYPVAGNAGAILSSYGNGYRGLQGTSMAAPHVAGAIAVIRSKPACATVSVAKIESAFKTTGPVIKDHRGSGLSRRRLDLVAAMEKLGCL